MSHPDLASEQRHFDAIYARLDAEIERAEARLAEVRLQPVGGQHQARFEREAFAGHLEERVAALRGHRRDDLCFGRLDMEDGTRLYIGRMGLADEAQEPLLVDWRAPAAAPFYQATPLDRQGVVRRRHFLTRRRTISAIEDDVLDAERIAATDVGSLRGEAALQYAMNTARTGRMREIAATIQKEQDEIIRAPLTPAVFVQGGPGTGKTAVALHRAAYLLYTHRRHLAASDVLVIGPNPVFLRYIEHVLPSLGETGASLHSLPQVYGLRDWAEETRRARTVKADPVMVSVIEAAIRTRERAPRRPLDVEVDGVRVRFSAGELRSLVAQTARRRGRHNERAAYLHGRIVRQLWRRGGRAFSDLWEYEDFRIDMLTHPRVRRVTMRVWPVLTPAELLNDLFGFPALLRAAGRHLLDEGAIDALGRTWAEDPAEAPWTDADAPLLDEAARQLGPIPAELDPALRRSRSVYDDDEARAEAEYERELLRGLGGGIVPKSVIQQRYAGGARPRLDDEEEAEAGGRVWRYAVVDEAQDLSPMDWRMIGRHAPRRAMTVVGDLAQGTEAWSARRWDEIRVAVDARADARLAELTINYRTPTEIADWAAEVLEVVDPRLRPPASVRSVPGSFAVEPVEPGGVASHAATAAVELRGDLGEGIACVVAPASLLGEVRSALAERVGHPVPEPSDVDALDAPVLAMTPDLAKGLEFDVVVVADPDAIVREHGWRALYVSATRATRRLLVVHTGAAPLPTR